MPAIRFFLFRFCLTFEMFCLNPGFYYSLMVGLPLHNAMAGCNQLKPEPIKRTVSLQCLS